MILLTLALSVLLNFDLSVVNLSLAFYRLDFVYACKILNYKQLTEVLA